jgi:signal transduction histidine kinase
MLNKDGVVITANYLAKKLMDRKDAPIIGRKIIETKEITTNKILIKLFRNLFLKGESFFYDDLPYMSKTTKETRHLNILAVPLFDNDQKVEGAISMAIDNTEVVNAKKQLEYLNISLEKKVKIRTEQLAIINEQLNKVLDLKQKFISDASHELRTPLTVIQGNIDLATQEIINTRKKIPEFFNLIGKEVRHMTNILTDLTLLTNADADTEKMNYEKIDLRLLIDAVTESLQIIAKKKNIRLIVKKNHNHLIIMGDEAKLERVILNLVRNAIKYNQDNGWVKIWFEEDKDEVKIIIKDNGIGIPEKDLPNIFERFYRVDKARSRAEGGTGLGLAIAKWITEAHGGKITVASEQDKGSAFTVHLPYRQL